MASRDIAGGVLRRPEPGVRRPCQTQILIKTRSKAAKRRVDGNAPAALVVTPRPEAPAVRVPAPTSRRTLTAFLTVIQRAQEGREGEAPVGTPQRFALRAPHRAFSEGRPLTALTKKARRAPLRA